MNVWRLSRLKSSIHSFIQRLVYETPSRASFRISYSPPNTISSDELALMSGSIGVEPAPNVFQIWLGAETPPKALPDVTRLALFWQLLCAGGRAGLHASVPGTAA